jgi:asparagine synthase (glutamine-hydrolysing)
MAAGRSQVTFRTPYLDNAIAKLAYQLPVADRRSPTPSTDVVKRLRPGLTAVPTDRGVSLTSSGVIGSARRGVAEVLFKLDYWDKEGLPGSLWAVDPVLSLLRSTPLLGQHKYLAYRRWFKGRLARLVEQVAAACDEITPYVDRHFLSRVAGQHASGRHNLLREISCVLTLAAIQRLFVRGDGESRPSIRSKVLVA